MANINANALGGVSTSSDNTSQKANDIPITQSRLTIHVLYDLPHELQQLDPEEEQLEIVMRPIVKYNYRDRRITFIPLEERLVTLSPSSIRSKDGRLVLDLDSVTPPDVGGVMAGASNHRDQLPPGAGDDNVDNNNSDISSNSRSGSGGGWNCLLLQYPFPRELTTVLDVLVGIRQRRIGCSFARWVTGNPSVHSVSQGVGCLSVAVEEVHRHKSVTRVIGLGTGGIVCSIAVCEDDDVAVVRGRLRNDMQRLSARMLSRSGEDINGNTVKMEDVDVDGLLAAGVSEAEVYRQLLLIADPNHYARRLRGLLTLYSTAPGCAEWMQRADGLLLEYAGREEELLRCAAVEVGPECCAVPLPYRLLIYRKKYSLTEKAILGSLQSAQAGAIHDIVDFEPEVMFASLTARFGREPRPTSYLFPTQRYAPDKRTFLLDTLCFPSKQFDEKFRELTVTSWERRLPFTMSPCERPLHIGTSSTHPGKPPSEIEILREKYAPEFAQIVPSIVTALEEVVKRNHPLLQQQETPLAVDDSFVPFQQLGTHPQLALQDFVHRIVDYTLISPASLLAAIIYLDRLCLRHPTLIITEQNVLRLFLTSVRVASKVVELRSINNRHFANVFGLDTVTINLLEGLFVKQMHFDVFLSPEDFAEYARVLQSANAPHLPSLPTQRGCIDPRTVIKKELPSRLMQETRKHQKSTTVNNSNSDNNTSHNNTNNNCPSMGPDGAVNIFMSSVNLSTGGEAAPNESRVELREACDGGVEKQGVCSPTHTNTRRYGSGTGRNERNYAGVNNGMTSIIVASREEVVEARRVSVGTRNQTGCKSKLAA